MRVAYICADAGVPVFGTKGCSVHIQEVVRQFLHADHAVTLCAVRTDGPSCFSDTGFTLAEFPVKGPSDALTRELSQQSSAEAMASQMEAGTFDLVYERYSLWSSAPMCRAQQLGIPSVLEVNAPLIEEQLQHRELIGRDQATLIRNRAFEAATTIVAVSDMVADYVKNCLPAEHRFKVHVVPNGVDTDRFRPDVPAIQAGDEFTVGFLGTIKPWHGLESLLEAFHRLHACQPCVKLRVIGDGPLRQPLQKMVADRYSTMQASVQWIGGISPAEVPAHLTALDVAVAPYLDLPNFYFSPLKVYEYMAAGCAVVASSIGQLSKLIDHGRTGMLYHPGDAQGLANVLAMLSSQPQLCQQLGAAARDTVVQCHSWRQTLETILDHVQADHMMTISNRSWKPDCEATVVQAG